MALEQGGVPRIASVHVVRPGEHDQGRVPGLARHLLVFGAHCLAPPYPRFVPLVQACAPVVKDPADGALPLGRSALVSCPQLLDGDLLRRAEQLGGIDTHVEGFHHRVVLHGCGGQGGLQTGPRAMRLGQQGENAHRHDALRPA